MENEMTALIENIKTNYFDWTTICAKRNNDGKLSDINRKMIAEFDENIDYKVGTKYIKVLNRKGSVWGFVVNTDNDKKFKKGDILKAAGWATPARNFARGNVFAGGYMVNWTGA